jgi:hypothetical protein
MPNYTLSYSEGVAGWVSFYSYYPDWMIGMNNYFYTFKGGNLYRHNTGPARNTFYQQWWNKVDNVVPPNNSPKAFKPSTIQTVFNNSVLENKLFKTLTLQGDSIWSATLQTDLQFSGFIQAPWFERKEATYFAFVRNNSLGELSLRSANGIGNSLTVDFAGTNNAEVNFSINPLVSVGNIISIGDYVYFGNSQANFAGPVVDIIIDYPNGINRLIINNNMLTPLTTTIPGDVNFFFFVKNSVAESHGVLGHYCTVTLQNDFNSKVELFSVESNVMKSFP